MSTGISFYITNFKLYSSSIMSMEKIITFLKKTHFIYFHVLCTLNFSSLSQLVLELRNGGKRALEHHYRMTAGGGGVLVGGAVHTHHQHHLPPHFSHPPPPRHPPPPLPALQPQHRWVRQARLLHRYSGIHFIYVVYSRFGKMYNSTSV